MPTIAATHAHRGLIWGIFLICSGLLHLVWRRYYARRSAAIQTAKRETAIAPLRRNWILPTSEHANLVYGTIVSALMVLGGIVLLLTGA
jgi:hypothetical protein